MTGPLTGERRGGEPRIGRLSLRIGAAVALGMVVAALIVLGLTSLQFSRELDASLYKEMGKLMPPGAPRDTASVAARVIKRAASRSTSMKIALLYDASGRRILGRVDLPLQRDGLVTLSYRDGDSKPKDGRAYTIRLRDGAHLSVLHHDEMKEVVRDMLPALILCLALSGALMGILASRAMARMIGVRLALTRATADAIAAGDLSKRIPVDDKEGIFAAQAESFNSMIARMEEMVEGQRHFASHLAHDLRTPLTRLRALLTRDAADPADFALMRFAAERECTAIIATFEALLRLSEIKAGRHDAPRAPLMLAELLEDVANTMEPMLAEAGYGLVIGPFAQAAVIGDRDLLLQLFMNLLENVALHTSPGTHARISMRHENGEAIVMLADDGPGLPEADRARVLRPFERGQDKGGSRGSGLGLAIAQAIMRFHDGSIQLRDGAPGMIVEMRFPASAKETMPVPTHLAALSGSVERSVIPAA
ncbi:sensor histidine kinase [Sphingomonas abietis]|uniref:histidine kinase n=1 Tax=Sphingomonas abietis TaxID=3012344 RepID=A0ABY7NGM3_9SPHN|nr:HAMP domain-containing sensor histidine kinase [Sphingomonas abietis]WBO20696.1 HAMP domain-containing sensor histidine kinase [Sphingomonas abietis]